MRISISLTYLGGFTVPVRGVVMDLMKLDMALHISRYEYVNNADQEAPSEMSLPDSNSLDASDLSWAGHKDPI